MWCSGDAGSEERVVLFVFVFYSCCLFIRLIFLVLFGLLLVVFFVLDLFRNCWLCFYRFDWVVVVLFSGCLSVWVCMISVVWVVVFFYFLSHGWMASHPFFFWNE